MRGLRKKRSGGEERTLVERTEQADHIQTAQCKLVRQLPERHVARTTLQSELDRMFKLVDGLLVIVGGLVDLCSTTENHREVEEPREVHFRWRLTRWRLGWLNVQERLLGGCKAV